MVVTLEELILSNRITKLNTHSNVIYLYSSKRAMKQLERQFADRPSSLRMKPDTSGDKGEVMNVALIFST